MDSIQSIALASTFMAGLGVALATALAFASRKLYVYEDPRIDEIEELLPNANCGACGSAGCRTFAEGLISGEFSPGHCTVNDPSLNESIADYLGVDLGSGTKQVARLACAGGSHVAWQRAHYKGLNSCRAANLVAGGGKVCGWGCLGLEDCLRVCEFDAITMDRHGLPVVDVAKCTACGDCIDSCPKQLFSLQPVDHQLWVACKNLEFGSEAESQCEVACNGCGRCVQDAPEGLISLVNNLAEIDYSRNAISSKLPIERCPTGAIVWFDKPQQQVKGVQSKKIIRQKPLPIHS